MLPLQANDVQAMLLQSEIVSEIHLSANWKPKYRDRTKQVVKKLNLCGKTAVGKSAWEKPCHRSKAKLPYDWVRRQANEIYRPTAPQRCRILAETMIIIMMIMIIIIIIIII